MSAPEITDKLNAFLSSHKPLRDECHAVYLLVEIRKLMHHFDFDAPLIRYYADWTVHAEKEFGTAHITAFQRASMMPLWMAIIRWSKKTHSGQRLFDS